jgi:hypothetical protein
MTSEEIYDIIRNIIIPVLMGWIGCELYHRWEDKNE